MSGVTQHEVHGVPLLQAPAVEGRCSGGIVFRVGHADETLPVRGITHLVEHLALQFLDVSAVHANGQTGPSTTLFHSSGSIDEVTGFLEAVTASLRDLSLERLETEKSILRTEEAGRSWGAAPGIPMWRYGAQGYGLSSYVELGLGRLTPDDVRAWVAEHFTRGNAAAWIAAPEVPADLDLRLPEGPRRPLPTVTSALEESPIWIRGRDGVVVLDAVVRRGFPAGVYTRVLEQALRRDLRLDGGLSYTTSAGYEPRDATHAYVSAMADALPEKQDAVVGAFVDVLARLRFVGPEEPEVALAVSRIREAVTHPSADSFSLPGEAVRLLQGLPLEPRDQVLARLDAVSVDDVLAIAREAHTTTLLQTPSADLEWAGYHAPPGPGSDRVDGESAAYVDHPDVTVVAGDAGVSLVAPEGGPTVRWGSVAAVQAYPDGGRNVIGLDGFTVRVEPTLLVDGDAVVAQVDAHAPAASVIPMPRRDEDEIPIPQGPPDAEGGTAERPVASWVRYAFWILLGWAVLSMTRVFTSLPSDDEPGSPGRWPVIALSVLFAVVVYVIPLLWLGRKAGYWAGDRDRR